MASALRYSTNEDGLRVAPVLGTVSVDRFTPNAALDLVMAQMGATDGEEIDPNALAVLAEQSVRELRVIAESLPPESPLGFALRKHSDYITILLSTTQELCSAVAMLQTWVGRLHFDCTQYRKALAIQGAFLAKQGGCE